MKLKTRKKLKFDSFNKTISSRLIMARMKFVPVLIVIFLVFSVLLYNLFIMQIVEGSDYLAASNQNYKSRNVLRAPRGVIYDFNSNRIAYNKQDYSVYIDKFEFNFERDGENLANILNIDLGSIEERVEDDEFVGRITLKNNLTHDEYLSLVNRIVDIPGVYSTSETNRVYKDSNIYSHIIGYLGDASEEDLGEKVDQFSRVGKTGIESVWDRELRGDDGVIVQEVDINSGDISTYTPTTAEPGHNVYLNLNSNWQELAFYALRDKVVSTGGQGGAMTIMDVETGAVKAMASYPTFSLYDFNEGISYDKYEALLKNPGTPLLDRNIGVAIPTGSIFKVFTGLITLEEEVIDTNTEYMSRGCMELPGEGRLCESFNRSLGSIDIYDAISKSSNIFFCESMRSLDDKSGGIETFIKYTNEFGVGKATGIDLPYESSGLMATPEVKWNLFSEPWYIGDSCNTSIGQGFLNATPMQMVVALASLENGGKILQPHIVNRIEDNYGNTIIENGRKDLRDISISPENIEVIKEGMRQAVEGGTATRLQDSGKNVIAKTGTATAQVTISGKTYTEPHAWVMGIFEHKGRKYAFVVNIAHGGWGSQAVEVAERVIRNIN